MVMAVTLEKVPQNSSRPEGWRGARCARMTQNQCIYHFLGENQGHLLDRVSSKVSRKVRA